MTKRGAMVASKIIMDLWNVLKSVKGTTTLVVTGGASIYTITEYRRLKMD